MKKIFVFVILISLSSAAYCQSRDSIWADHKYFLGKWEGIIPGSNEKIEREYSFLFDKAFIRYSQKNRSNKDEIIGLFSYYKPAKEYVTREYNSNGSVVLYRWTSKQDSSFTMKGEFNENLPAGTKFRMKITLINKNEFVEYIETSAANEAYHILAEVRFKRK